MQGPKNPLAQILNQSLQVQRDLLVATRLSLCREPFVAEFPFEDSLIRLYVPWAATDIIQRSIVLNGRFNEFDLLKTIRRFVTEGSYNVIDAGANIGNHAVFFSQFLTSGTVHAFEALPPTYEILRRNVELNPRGSIVPHNVLLGEQDAEMVVTRFVPGNVGATSFRPAIGTPQKRYAARSIDSLGIENVGFMKIDVEGLQHQVLSGARRTIERDRPLLWMEVNEGDADVGPLLASLGYSRKQALDPTNFLWRPD
jgi:FkbM family methyltransferase